VQLEGLPVESETTEVVSMSNVSAESVMAMGADCKFATDRRIEENTGIVIAYPIVHAMSQIDSNPIGVPAHFIRTFF
jgi:hypothetical protein